VPAAAAAAAAGPRFRAAAAVDLAADNHSECECLFPQVFVPAAEPAGGENTAGTAADGLRFRAAVVDVALDAAARAARDCGVFIVPQVRF